MKQFFIDHSPNNLFVLTSNLIHKEKHKENIQIRQYKDHWLIQRNDIFIHSPTPKFYGLSNETFENKFEKHFQIQKNDTVIDIGASLGDTTLIILKKVGDKGKVIAIEPEPTNLKYLKMNTSNHNNIKILDFAVSNKKGYANLNTHSLPTGHSLKWGNNAVKVKTDTLDNITENYDKIDYIKIDVQGSEIDVLQNTVKTFDKCKKWVIETHNKNYLNQYLYPVTKIMESAGFKTKINENYVVHAYKGN